MHALISPFVVIFLSLGFSLSTKAQTFDDSYINKLLSLETNYNPEKEIGPNCWNLALHSLGWEPALLFTDSSQIDDVLTSPYCAQVSEKEIRKFDIGVIKTEFETHLHAFVVLNSKTGLTKDLGSADGSYRRYHQEPIKLIFNNYHQEPSSDFCRKNPDAEQSPCGSVLSYYRCESAPVLASSPATLWLGTVEKNIENYYVTKSTTQVDVLKNLISVYTQISPEEVLAMTMAHDKEKLLLSVRIRAVLDFVVSYNLNLSLHPVTLALRQISP